MDRKRKRVRQPRPQNETSREEQMIQPAEDHLSPNVLQTPAENTFNIALHSSSRDQPSGHQNGSYRPNDPGASQVPAAAPQLSSTPGGYGNTTSLGTQYQLHDLHNFGGTYTPGLDAWNYQNQARPGPIVPEPVTQFHSPDSYHSQGVHSSTSSFLFPTSSCHVQSSTAVPNQYGNILMLPSDGDMIQVFIKIPGRFLEAKLRLSSDYSTIQQGAVKSLGLKPYRVPSQKQKFITTSTGAQTPKYFVPILLDTVGYPITDLELGVQLTVDDSTEPPVTLGKGFIFKAMEKMVSPRNDIVSVQHNPFVQGHPSQMQHVMTPAPVWLPGFTPFTQYRSFQTGPTNLIIPTWSRPGVVNTESTSFDSLSPSLQPSGQSGDVETISSATSPMEDVMPLDPPFQWDDFRNVNLDPPSQEYPDN